MTNKLKPCPACGESGKWCANYRWLAHRYIECTGCRMRGPIDDPTGEKWNALPRRDECQAAITAIAPWLSASLSDDCCQEYIEACEAIFKLDRANET